jgi:hypothetical protein
MKSGKSRTKSGKAARRSSKKKAPPKKPRGEELLDRLDKNPHDQRAWDELATGIRSLDEKPSKRLKERKTDETG